MRRRRCWVVATLLLLAQAAGVAVAIALSGRDVPRVFWVVYLVVATVLYVAFLIQLQQLARRR